MKIEPKEISIREVAENYVDDGDGGVYGLDGELVLRPPYQREYIYQQAQRNAVIDTVMSGFPLNLMYWSPNPKGFELLDGQQRTISICQYVNGDFPVKKGDKIAGTRIIPLVIEKSKMDKAEKVAGTKPIFSILPYRSKKVGIITTGSEVQKGLIKDTFTPVLKEKLDEFSCQILGQTLPGDERSQITSDILSFIDQGADMVICSGGMSVDPDDRTPGAIKDTGAEIVTYGAPVLPGAMLLLSYYQNNDKIIPILGLPGCVMYARRTVFDLILPRIMADDRICADEIASYGEGGLCLNCDVCTFPACGFGK